MAGRKWISVAKGIAIFSAVTFFFYGVAKLLVNPVAGRNAESYRYDQQLQPPVGDWFIQNANMYADSVPIEWLIIFGIFCLIVGLFGRGSNHLTIASLTILTLALSLNYYFVLNAIFDWYYWSCFEEPHTQEGFALQLILECPPRNLLYDSLVWAPVGLAIVAGVLAASHSRQRSREGSRHPSTAPK